MDTALLGKILGAYLLVNGLGFLISSDFYRRLRAESQQADRLTVNLSGMVHFILGMAIVATHLLWGSLLQVLVTIAGIGFVAKGIAMIIVPEWTLRSSPASERSLRLSGAAFVVAGAVFGYLSYFG
jgi:uncharacterized protein YjeT (DUF2065 family)